MSSVNKHSQNTPYKLLGEQLKKLRETRAESLAEVSGAVEIETDFLNLIETGKERPSEDILLLLISHFSTKEDVAAKLWKLAGYDQNLMSSDGPVNEESNHPTVMVMPMDSRIVYSDMVNVMANNFGVVMNFMQSSSPNSQPVVIGRMGMSREHAKSVIEVLQKTLNQTEPKAIPASTQRVRSNKKAK
jgi:hypothetical protein